MIKTLSRQIKQYKWPSIVAVLFTVLEVIMEIAIPLLMAKIIDLGIEAGDMKQVYFYGGIMLVAVVFSLTCGVLAAKYAAYASTGFSCNLRSAMFGNIQTFSFANIDKFSTPSLVTRLTTDVTNVQNAYQMILRMCVRAPITLVCALTMSIIINAKVSMVFVVVIIFLGSIMALLIKTCMPLFQQVFSKYDDLNASVQENVTGIRVVKAFVREDHENKKFAKAVDRVFELFTKAEGLLAFNNPVMMFSMYSCILGLSWLGAKMIVQGSMTTGELTSLLSYVMSILMSLMMLSMVFVMITMSIASMRRIAEVIGEETTLHNPENPVKDVKDGSIDFEKVSFAYKEGKGKNVLCNINFSVKSGETIGIIGGTGSAKTSLVNLISRLYDVKGGRVLVAGIDVKNYDMESLRNQVAVVLQKNELFSGTILENLRWGNEGATEEECMEACKMACAHEFIEKFKDGYHTHIEQGGSNVSGGQKQRLCIARALLKKPKILILDDSTSAVDTATDAKIRESFSKFIPGTTKLIIAQRISSIESADRILVLDNGEIDGFGTHDELLNTNEIYKNVYESQTKGSGDFDQKGE